MSEIEIVDADFRHIDAIADLESRYIDCAWTAEQVKTELEKPSVIFLVAERDGIAVGYVSGEIAADEIELGNITVDADFRRQGIATRLLYALKDHAQRSGIKRVFLLVSEQNVGAIELYRTVGFEKKGLRRKYYGNSDAVIMELDI